MGLKAIISALLGAERSGARTRRGVDSGRGDDCYEFALTGALDQHSAPNIREVLFEEALAHRKIRIDLSDLQLIDAAGLTILVEAFASAQRAGVDMAFRSPSEPIRRALRFTRLDRVLPILDSADSPIPPEVEPAPRGGLLTGRAGLRLSAITA
jgi:anti-anti-sigma factor